MPRRSIGSSVSVPLRLFGNFDHDQRLVERNNPSQFCRRDIRHLSQTASEHHFEEHEEQKVAARLHHFGGEG